MIIILAEEDGTQCPLTVPTSHETEFEYTLFQAVDNDVDIGSFDASGSDCSD